MDGYRQPVYHKLLCALFSHPETTVLYGHSKGILRVQSPGDYGAFKGDQYSVLAS